LPDEFIEHGDPAALLNHYGLDAEGIRASILRFTEKVLAAKPSCAVAWEARS